MGYSNRVRQGEAVYRFKGLPSRKRAKAGDGMLPSDFFHRDVVLSFNQDASGSRLVDVV